MSFRWQKCRWKFPSVSDFGFLKIFFGEIQEVGGNVAPGKAPKLWRTLVVWTKEFMKCETVLKSGGATRYRNMLVYTSMNVDVHILVC